MIVDFGKPVVGLDNVAFKQGDKTLTVGQVCCDSLMAPEKSGGNPEASEMLKRYMLATSIYGQGEVEITSSEASLILNRLAVTHGTIVYGQLHGLLEGVK